MLLGDLQSFLFLFKILIFIPRSTSSIRLWVLHLRDKNSKKKAIMFCYGSKMSIQLENALPKKKKYKFEVHFSNQKYLL